MYSSHVFIVVRSSLVFFFPLCFVLSIYQWDQKMLQVDFNTINNNLLSEYYVGTVPGLSLSLPHMLI